MKLFRQIKSKIQKLAQKRANRRNRVKGTRKSHLRTWQTPAQALVDSYYTGRVGTKSVATGAGVKRAAHRSKLALKNQNSLARPFIMSRQVRRRLERKAA